MRRSTKVILIIFVVIVCLVAFIFCNSAAEQKESAEKSTGILKFIIETFNIEDAAKINDLHKAIRKSAHVIEFTALGVLLSMLFRKFERRSGRKYIACPLFIGLMVGVFDEFIQSFNDRSSEVGDILIDFGGVLLGLFVTMCLYSTIDKKRRERRHRRIYESEKNYGSE